MVTLQLFQSAPPDLASHTEQSLRRLSADVGRAIALLQGPRAQRLFQLQTSPRWAAPAGFDGRNGAEPNASSHRRSAPRWRCRYLERLSESLQQLLRLSRAMTDRLGANAAKRTKLTEQIQEATAAIARNLADARALKSKVRARGELCADTADVAEGADNGEARGVRARSSGTAHSWRRHCPSSTVGVRSTS